MKKTAAFSIACLTMLAACGEGTAARTSLEPRSADFAKPASNPDLSATFVLTNSASYGLRGDGKYLDDAGGSRYADGVCGVTTKIFTSNGGGDATMQTNNPKAADRKCVNYPRKVYVAGETNALVEVQLYVPRVDQPGAEIPVGSSVDRNLSINPASGPCTRYNFDGNGSDRVTVTRTSATTWLVETKPAPNNRAQCFNDGTIYSMDVSFTIRTP